MHWQRSSEGTRAAKPKRQHAQLGAGLAALLAILLVAWLLIDDNESTADTSPAASSEAEIVSIGSLQAAATANETTIYWAGPPDGSKLELSRPSVDRIYLRYLTGGADAGDPRPFLTVGSYRLADPVAALREQGAQPGGVLATAPGDGTVYFNRERPQSVYLAYPGEDVEVEVYAPDFKQALQLVTSGRIVPVE